MGALIASIAKTENSTSNSFCPGAELAHDDSVISNSTDRIKIGQALYSKACAFLKLGDEQAAEILLEGLLNNDQLTRALNVQPVLKELAITEMRIGERSNCIHNHCAESCIFPINGNGVHYDKSGSERAIQIYKALLENSPHDLESRWLLNIAYMTVGEYPQNVPTGMVNYRA